MLSSNFELRVKAADPSAELFLLDRTFTIIASGIGHLEATLPRGLYKIRLRLGMTTKEAHLALDGEASRLIDPSSHVSLSTRPDMVDVHFGEIEFASPVPLRATSRTHEYHFDNAARISAHTTRVLGSGGKIFIFSRTWSPSAEQGRFSGWDPMTGLALHDANGGHLCQLSGSSESDRSGDPWAGCNLAVRPGSYRLRRDGATVLEMPLFVPEGWQLQVFLLASPNGRPESPSIDFGRAAVLLSRRPFDHADPAWRLTEQARQGLSLRRSVVRADDLQQMFFIKFDSPMLGIYGAHLLLTCAARPNVALLRQVVRNLRRLIGPHPDVEAIALGFDMPVEHAHVFRWPPMLATSWELIVRASAVHPELVPTHCPAAWAAPRLWTSGGPWLMWSPVDDTRVAKPDSLFRENLSPSEARVWQYWRAQAPPRPRAVAKPTKAKVAVKTVVNDLSLPASVVTDAASSLARRLTTTEIPSNSFRDHYAARAIAMMTKGNVEVMRSDDVSARVVTETELSRGADGSGESKVWGVGRAEDGAIPVALDPPGRVVLQARHSSYPGPTPPWRPMHSRFAGRRVPEAEDRKPSRAGFGRLIVESDSEEELYFEIVEEDILDLPSESTGDQVIYVSLVGGNDGPVAGFASHYRGPYHTIGFASKIEDRSLLFTLVLDNNIECIRCPRLQLSEAVDGIQYVTIPPIQTTYELDVEFARDEEW